MSSSKKPKLSDGSGAGSGTGSGAGSKVPTLDENSSIRNAIPTYYGRYIEFADGTRFSGCLDPLLTPKCTLRERDTVGAVVDVDLQLDQGLKMVESVKKEHCFVKVLVITSAHSSIVPIEVDPPKGSSSDLFAAAMVARAAAVPVVPPPYPLRSIANAGQAAAFQHIMAPAPPEVYLRLATSNRFSRVCNFKLFMRNLFRINTLNDEMLNTTLRHLIDGPLNDDSGLYELFESLNESTQKTHHFDSKYIQELMGQLSHQSPCLSEELKQHIRGDVLAFSPEWPTRPGGGGDGVGGVGDGVGGGGGGGGGGGDGVGDGVGDGGGSTETLTHRFISITNGENDEYELSPPSSIYLSAEARAANASPE